jgi:hypothetical protein
MIPCIDDFLDEITQLQTSNNFKGFYYLDEILYNYLKEISTKGMVAYVEADYFGGKGQQGAVVWDVRECILFKELSWEMGAINEALRLLGIIKIGSKDEFETVRLSKRRHTDDWIEN